MNRLSLWLYVGCSCLACEAGLPWPSQPGGIPAQPSETEAASNQPPVPNSAATVTVQVTSAGRPVSGAFVTGFHETARTFVSLSREPVYTDVNGRYEFSNVLPGTVYLAAEKESYLRPCMIASTVDGDTNLELELVTRSGLRPLRPAVPTLSGIVYDEQVRPVGAALVSAFWVEEIPELFTMTDEKGRYLLCGFPHALLNSGVIRAHSSRREAVHDFFKGEPAASQGDGHFVLDLHLKRR